MNSDGNERMKWWREARFGMFIHWGVYAIPAGEWKGRRIEGIAEWIMNRARIPVGEYEQLAAQFNPVDFDADHIASLAKRTGMRHIVITSKHHDGFAMFKSEASPYNIVDATPFGRDPIGELSAACARAGLRFGVYYSQSQDWHHPDAAGNGWDFPDESKKDFQRYLDEKVYPQLDELLSNYGPISVLWFDTPVKITARQARGLMEFVRARQPDCIINSRLGPGAEGLGDYISLRDNEAPTVPLDQDAETCATLNRTWGYSKFDGEWKTPEELTRMLSDLVAKNANYLLNIGPDARGRVPEKSERILLEVGKWLEANGESIHGAAPTPFHVDFEWGAVTRRPGRLYCHLHRGVGPTLALNGVQSDVRSARFPGGAISPVTVDQGPAGDGSEARRVSVTFGAAPATLRGHAVLELELADEGRFHPGIVQSPDGEVILESPRALEATSGRPAGELVLSRGSVGRSLEEGMELVWNFDLLRPGRYEVVADCAGGRNTDWGAPRPVDTGHEIALVIESATLEASIEEHDRQPIRGNHHWSRILSRLGEVQLSKPGATECRLTVRKVTREVGEGFLLRALRLVPLET